MDARHWSALGFLSLIWGSSYMLIKIGLRGTGPYTLVFLRVFLGALFLWGVVGWRRCEVPASARVLGALGLVGLFNNAVPFTLITWGQTTIDSSLAAILNSVMPLFTVLIAHVGLKDERIGGTNLLGLVIGFAGVVTVIKGGSEGLSLTALWNGELGAQLAVVGASFCYAGSTVFIRRDLKEINPFVLAALQLTVSSLLMPAAVYLWEWPVPFRYDPGALAALATLGVINTGVAYLLYFYLVTSAGATRTALVAYLIPVFGLFFGVVFLGEPLHLTVVMGFLTILTGVYLVDRGTVDVKKDAVDETTES